MAARSARDNYPHVAVDANNPIMAPIPAEIAERIAVAEAFSRFHGIVCSGSPHTTPCDQPAVGILLLHAAPFAICCATCMHPTINLVIAMGHGSCTTIGVLAQRADGSPEHAPDWLASASRTLRTRHLGGMTVRKGQYWTAAKEAKYRRSLTLT